MENPHRDESWLCVKYYEEGLSINDMADLAGVSHTTIWRNMKKNGVERRTAPQNKPVQYFTDENGYERIRTDINDGEYQPTVYVHQLIAVADGVPPQKIFGDGHYDIHHKNNVPWDNRSKNLRYLTKKEHIRRHRLQRRQTD